VEITLSEINPDIVVLTEHKMNSEEIVRLNVDNYSLVASYSRSTTSGGGSLIMARRGVVCCPVQLPDSVNSLIEDKVFEACIVKVNTNSFSFLLVGIYRSPNSKVDDFLNKLEYLIDYLLKKSKYIFIVGDININVLENTSRDLSNLLSRHGLKYIVDFPTRVGKTSETAIDNCLTNFNEKHLKVEGLITALSDHDGQLITINKTFSHSTTTLFNQYQHNFSKQNKANFKKMLENETWAEVYNAPVDTKFDTFYKIFLEYFNTAFPRIVVKKNKKRKAWFDDNLKNEKTEVVQLEKLARKTKNTCLANTAKNRSKLFHNKARKAKRSYYEKLINNSENIIKATWKVVNEEVGKSANKGPKNLIINNNGKEYSDPKEIAKLFNHHFINIANSVSQIGHSLNNDKETDPHQSNFLFSETNPEEVKKIIDSFKNKASAGYDGVPMTIIKDVQSSLHKVLSYLINISFTNGIFPDKLKISKVIPIYKKGDTKAMSNYRPVSLLPVISKIFEKAMYNRLLSFLDHYSLFDEGQHGFRKGRSTITAAIQFIESVIDSVDNHEKVIGIFMDLCKAFESVCHKILLKKLKSMGVKGLPLQWLESYLHKRLQFVELTHTQGSWLTTVRSPVEHCVCGVPQGSILGPLLFLCYIQGMPRCLSTTPQDNFCLYADDANLKISGSSQNEIEEFSMTELTNILNFLNSNNLKLNAAKSQFISFSTLQTRTPVHPVILIDSEPIEEVNEATFLGLMIDKHFTWNSHVEHLVTKINSGLYALKRMAYLCNERTLKQVYFALIHSNISYGLCLYGATSNANLDKVLMLQKKAIRIILGLGYRDSCQIHFRNLQIMTVYGLYIFQCVMYAKEQQLKGLVGEEGVCHGYNTRGRKEVHQGHHKLKFFEKKTSYAGLKLYRKLPQALKNNTSRVNFSKKLKQLLTEMAPYSINEFEEKLAMK